MWLGKQHRKGNRIHSVSMGPKRRNEKVIHPESMDHKRRKEKVRDIPTLLQVLNINELPMPDASRFDASQMEKREAHRYTGSQVKRGPEPGSTHRKRDRYIRSQPRRRSFSTSGSKAFIVTVETTETLWVYGAETDGCGFGMVLVINGDGAAAVDI